MTRISGLSSYWLELFGITFNLAIPRLLDILATSLNMIAIGCILRVFTVEYLSAWAWLISQPNILLILTLFFEFWLQSLADFDCNVEINEVILHKAGNGISHIRNLRKLYQ